MQGPLQSPSVSPIVCAMKSNSDQLVQALAQQLLTTQRSVTTAESCTGGGIAKALTDIAGSSRWFEAGFITYSNRMKNKVLGVPESVFSEYGAVSEACARAMAEGAIALSGADYAMAVSGIAGPGGATADKPVGCVYIAWGAQHTIQVMRYQFEGDRESVRQQSIDTALANLLQEITG